MIKLQKFQNTLRCGASQTCHSNGQTTENIFWQTKSWRFALQGFSIKHSRRLKLPQNILDKVTLHLIATKQKHKQTKSYTISKLGYYKSYTTHNNAETFDVLDSINAETFNVENHLTTHSSHLLWESTSKPVVRTRLYIVSEHWILRQILLDVDAIS